jgi:hypothetical protein
MEEMQIKASLILFYLKLSEILLCFLCLTMNSDGLLMSRISFSFLGIGPVREDFLV